MNIPVKANTRVGVIKAIKKELIKIKIKNEDYAKNGEVMVLAQTTKQMVKNIRRTEDDKYMTDVLFYSMPLHYNYHGIYADSQVVSR